MKDRSATTSAGAGVDVSAASVRTLMPSRTSTRGSCAQLVDELVVADVDRDDVRGAAAQQHVGEAAGARAGVEAAPPGDDRARPSPRASSAPASLCAAREAYPGSSSSGSTAT